jgi:hypothetical protein
VKIRVLEGQQLANDTEKGGVYVAGDEVEVDDDVGQRAIDMGVAEEVTAKAAASKAEKSTTKSTEK